MDGEGRVGRVLLDSPLPQLDHLFDYFVPSALLDEARPGVRVRVPLRTEGRFADGYLIEFAEDGQFPGKLSAVDSIVSSVAVLTPEIGALARQVADRGAGSAIDVVRLAVPPRQVRVEKAWLAAQTAHTEANGASSALPDAAAPTAPPLSALGYPEGSLERAFEADQRLAIHAAPRLVELADGSWIGQWALLLAQLAAACWLTGRTAILAVPDYRDQAQVERALDALGFNEAVARLDARQSNPDRYRAFLSCLEGARIVVGNRSAVYAPAHELGLIAMWDDGDPLHSEPLSPYVHARDAALVRQQLQGGTLAFASHTRSIEVQRLVELGYVSELAPVRAVLPHVIATEQQATDSASLQNARIPSSAWRAAREALKTGPILVQVARPGYAPVLACANCGQPARCAICDGPLGLASARAVPSCRWCGALATTWSCTRCQHTGLRMASMGAGRTAEDLGRAFPGVKVLVSDGETPRLEVSVEPALVIATRGAEPLTPGGYSAVLLLDGERMLNRESLSVADDCLRWWSNAASLARTGAPVVLVGVGGPLARALATWRQSDYVSRELIERRALTLPPAVRIASVIGAPTEVERAISDIHEADMIDVLGPTPVGDGLVRSIVRFEYVHGAAVAAALRAAIIRNATAKRKPPGAPGGSRRGPTLKVHFDDPEIL